MPVEPNWIERAFASEDFQEIIGMNRKVINPERTIMVDTNYLIQISTDDLEAIVLDPSYVSMLKPLPRQMAMLFRNLLDNKIDLCLSKLIMQEFMPRVPRKNELFELYKRHIITIVPKNNSEPSFWDLASAVNACMNLAGLGTGDIKDTYSYLLAILAKARFFVTEDKHIEMVYNYLSSINQREKEAIKQEIEKIRKAYNAISDHQTNFPIDKILDFIFQQVTYSEDRLTVPISLYDLKNQLPEVLDRFSTVLWIMRSIKELEYLKTRINKLPDDWDASVLIAGQKRLHEILQAVSLQDNQIDEGKFKIKIIEKENAWTIEQDDKNLSYSLANQVNILQCVINQEFEDPNEYYSLEEYFSREKADKKFKVSCEKCGFTQEITAEYSGITYSEEREMGAENYHLWSAITNCPKCSSEMSIESTVYEYPIFIENVEETKCEGCKLIEKK